MTKTIGRYLAALAFAVTAGGADPAGAMLDVPVALVPEALDDAELDLAQRKRVVALLAADPRAQVRVDAAVAAGEARDEATLRRLAIDRDRAVRVAAGHGVGALLAASDPFERMRVVADWALADEPSRRAALARGLQHAGLEAVGLGPAIAHLACDRSVEVRRLALGAVAIHGRADDRHAAVARAALGDPDRRVRRLARRVVARRALG